MVIGNKPSSSIQNNNRGTQTQQSTSDFDANGNLLALDNIGTLHWYYNNTLNSRPLKTTPNKPKPPIFPTI